VSDEALLPFAITNDEFGTTGCFYAAYQRADVEGLIEQASAAAVLREQGLGDAPPPPSAPPGYWDKWVSRRAALPGHEFLHRLIAIYEGWIPLPLTIPIAPPEGAARGIECRFCPAHGQQTHACRQAARPPIAT